MEKYYTELYKHRYSKGIPTAFVQETDTGSVRQVEIHTTIQVGFKSHAANKMKAIVNHILSDANNCRVTCFHVKYNDGVELVFLPSFYNHKT